VSFPFLVGKPINASFVLQPPILFEAHNRGLAHIRCQRFQENIASKTSMVKGQLLNSSDQLSSLEIYLNCDAKSLPCDWLLNWHC